MYVFSVILVDYLQYAKVHVESFKGSGLMTQTMTRKEESKEKAEHSEEGIINPRLHSSLLAERGKEPH